MKALFRDKKVVKTKINPFTDEEVEKILEHTNLIDRPLMLLMFRSGLRLGEALGLNWDSVNTNTGFIMVKRSFRASCLSETTKTGKDRTVPIDDEVIAELNRLKKLKVENELKKIYSDAVFTKAGKRLSQNAFRYVWKRTLERAGIEYRKTHTIRHTVASKLLNGGFSPKIVATLLGHTVQTLLSTYSHILEDEKVEIRNMVNSLKLLQPAAENNHPTQVHAII